jgi:FtsH-binding integral membrane protein
MVKGEQHISIWFFVGLLLLVYGVLITGAGIYNYYYPPERTVVLAHLHAAIWWGLVLLVLGCVYSYFFSPKRQKEKAALRKAAGR